ncbi:hypothetical protein SAMN04489841_3515 [Natrinema salaciae]|uniref:WYL domain-containing protein n=2 Tax=Natrinema salaciae TaxID=1186196 RepID=A0A1H9MVI1_9EURY|nr:hypothetical protein SAMN04489841_3515 [Natrinema salaciae]
MTFLTVGFKVWTTLNMSEIICKAIREQKVLEFTYDGHHRKVEPYCHGQSKKGKESLRGYQIAGGSNSRRVPFWRLFTVAKMGNLTLTDETFNGNRPHYNPNDKDLSPIHCNI